MRRAAEDDVVQHFDLQQLAGAYEVARDLEVGLRGRGIAAGVIMDRSEERRVGKECRL